MGAKLKSVKLLLSQKRPPEGRGLGWELGRPGSAVPNSALASLWASVSSLVKWEGWPSGLEVSLVLGISTEKNERTQVRSQSMSRGGLTLDRALYRYVLF